jgi:hypothetical protein
MRLSVRINQPIDEDKLPSGIFITLFDLKDSINKDESTPKSIGIS